MNEATLELVKELHKNTKILAEHLNDHIESVNKLLNDVPTHQELEKMNVGDELAQYFREQNGCSYPIIAKAAIEFFKKRMPKCWPDNGSKPSTFSDGYNNAIGDVRQALFGEA